MRLRILQNHRVTTPNQSAVDRLVNEHYDELKAVARNKRRRAPDTDGMLTTDLLHEAWLKLRRQADWADETHFLKTCALAMRQVIIDAARRRLRDKRGGGAKDLDYEDWEDVLPDFSESPEDIVVMGDLLDRLGEEAPDLAEVVTLRYFGGFTEVEAAHVLGVTDRTVRRKWQLARAWLADHMQS